MDNKIKDLINELIEKVEIRKINNNDSSVVFIGPQYFPDYSNCLEDLNQLRKILEIKFLNVHKNITIPDLKKEIEELRKDLLNGYLSNQILCLWSDDKKEIERIITEKIQKLIDLEDLISKEQSTGPIGILNQGKNNTFTNNEFEGFGIGIKDEGENTNALDNKFFAQARSSNENKEAKVLKLEPEIYGVGINLRALWNRITKWFKK